VQNDQRIINQGQIVVFTVQENKKFRTGYRTLSETYVATLPVFYKMYICVSRAVLVFCLLQIIIKLSFFYRDKDGLESRLWSGSRSQLEPWLSNNKMVTCASYLKNLIGRYFTVLAA